MLCLRKSSGRKFNDSVKHNEIQCTAVQGKRNFWIRMKEKSYQKCEYECLTDKGKDASTYIESKEPSCQLVTVNDTLLRGEGCSQVSAALCPWASSGVMLTRQGRGGQIVFCTTGGRCFGLYHFHLLSSLLFFIFRNSENTKV